jgi:hypothetical protein
MFKRILLLLACIVVCLPVIGGFGPPDQIDRKQLRDILVQLGYDVKDLDKTPGKEKYSFTVERSGLNIPVAIELSANGSYIWLTVFCKDGAPGGDKAVNLLRRNADVQPSMFYVTKSNKIMMGLPIENQGVTNAALRQRAEKICDDVVKTKDDWQN